MASPTPIRTPSRRTEACAAGGFTLLELLVVMGLLSVLTGMAVGVLGRRDPHMIAASTIGGACRAAQVTARSQGVPTEVWLRPGVDNQPASVQTLLLRPVAVFGFEPGQSSYDEALEREVEAQRISGNSADCAEAVSAFLEKRTQQFLRGFAMLLAIDAQNH